MFDWPLAIQTSPTSTFFNSILFVPSMESVCGPPAERGFSSTCHLPSLAVASTDWFPNVYLDLFVGCGRAPDFDRLVALQHHVIGEESMGFDFAAGGGRPNEYASRENNYRGK